MCGLLSSPVHLVHLFGSVEILFSPTTVFSYSGLVSCVPSSKFLVLVRVPSSFSCRSLLPRDPLCSIDLLCYPRPLPKVGWTVGMSATASHVLSPPLFLVALVSIVCARFLWVIHLSFVGPLCDPCLLELSVLLEAGGTVGVMAFIKRVLVIIPLFS